MTSGASLLGWFFATRGSRFVCSLPKRDKKEEVGDRKQLLQEYGREKHWYSW